MTEIRASTEQIVERVHPADIGYLTCSEVQRLTRSLGSFSRELTFIDQDLTRAALHDKKIVYMLDFSELYAQLWPESSKSQNKAVAHYLLTKSPFDFALPPGTLVELIHKLSGQASEQNRTQGRLLDLMSKPFVRAFLKAYTTPVATSLEPSPTLFGEPVFEILGALRELRNADERLERLARLYETGRLKLLSDYIDPSEIVPEPEVFHESYLKLTSRRSAREDIINYVDAHNYALTYSLNKATYGNSKLFFLLVTSSAIPFSVFDAIEWKEDPFYLESAKALTHTSLVRHPVQLLCQSYLKGIGEDSHQQLRRALADLAAIQQALTNIPVYQRYIRKDNVVGSTPVRLPRNARYVKRFARYQTFYQNVYRPLNELLSTDAAQEGNRRQLGRIEQESVAGLYLFDERAALSPAVQQIPDFRSLIALFDRFLNLTRVEISRARQSLKHFQQESVGNLYSEKLGFGLDRLDVERKDNRNFGCVEATVRLIEPGNPATNIFLSADRYPGYVSYWWRTNIVFTEFIKYARFFAQNTRLWLDTVPQAEPHGQKEYEGIYFFLDDEIKHFNIAHGDHSLTDSIVRLCEPHWRIRFVRLALPYADLCYDFEPVESFPQRAGLVTHLGASRQIADFIQNTHSQYVNREAIRKAVDEIWEHSPSADPAAASIRSMRGV